MSTAPTTRVIQYIGNKPKKRDTILRTDREWERGSVIEVPAAEASAYLRHKDIFADVTDKLDDEGNPPELPELVPPRPDRAKPQHEERTLAKLRQQIEALEGDVESLEDELGGSKDYIKQLEADLGTRDEQLATQEATIAGLRKQLAEAGKTVTEVTDGKQETGSGQEQTEPTDVEARRQAILNVLEKLNQETDFDREGKPKVEPISKLLGWKVSAQERDAAWQLVLDANKGE